MTKRQDVISFIYRYPWMPKQIGVAQLGIKGYDWDNALGQTPKLRERRRDWQPGRPGQTSERVREILLKGWEYYFTNVMEVDFGAPPEAWFRQVITLNAPRGQGWSFLSDGEYFRLGFGSDYEEWIANENTAVSFAAFRCFPGEAVLDSAGIKPWMFAQTGRGQMTVDEVVDRVRYLYEKFWYEPESGLSAGEQYGLHYQTAAFLPERWLRDHGLPKRRWDALGITRRAIKEQIAQAYGDYENERAWNAGRFRADHPDLQLDRCFICGKSSGVELHHLLPRARFPRYIWESKNVVPVCPQLHRAIPKMQLPAPYEEAIGKWIDNPDPEIFCELLEEIHRRADEIG